jgi:hypothetical protein
MFETITSAIIAHKQIVIAAIAITGLIGYSIPNNMLASAQSFFFPDIPGLPDNVPGLPRTIDRDIEIPCRPYCNIDNQPEDVNVDIDDILHLHLGFSFV